MSSLISDLRVANPSVSSLARSQSIRSQRTQHVPSATRTVVTSPPWARDEPPSPTEHVPASANSIDPRPSQSGLSSKPRDSSASTSNHTATRPHVQKEEPLWSMFTRREREEGPPQRTPSARHNWPILSTKAGGSGEKRDSERPMKERTRTTWLTGTQRVRYQLEPAEGDPDLPSDDENCRGRWGLHISLPTPAPFTLAQNRTPGWETPWSPRVTQLLNATNGQGSNLGSREGSFWAANDFGDAAAGGKRTKWYYRRKAIRAFILNNNYVPLLFRVINITLTTAALALAINIRLTEMKYSVMGAVGSSTTLVIIFAPLTLVHVMIAIYLEYFGRPLGLWRTSSKLIYTLSETLFVCAWSAALALCFDNFFTSVIGCASPSSISWYNEIPRTIPDVPNLGHGEGQPGDNICDHQVALICMVFLGLIMYCTNLFISLFRIFEKVKYHSASLPR